jgi:hypothetical protein
MHALFHACIHSCMHPFIHPSIHSFIIQHRRLVALNKCGVVSVQGIWPRYMAKVYGQGIWPILYIFHTSSISIYYGSMYALYRAVRRSIVASWREISVASYQSTTRTVSSPAARSEISSNDPNFRARFSDRPSIAAHRSIVASWREISEISALSVQSGVTQL